MTLPPPISFLGVVFLTQSTHGEKKISSRLVGVASLPNTLPVSERTRCLHLWLTSSSDGRPITIAASCSR